MNDALLLSAIEPFAQAASATARLTVRGVSRSFGKVRALDDVSFSVHECEFVAVLGPSGSGKTTLFKCMTGLMASDRGSVHVGGLDVSALRGRARRHIAVVFQQFNLVARLSALANVLAGRLGHVAQWRGWVRTFSRADLLLAYECLDRVGLLAQAQQRADTLSGGQQQRVAIARALAQRPDIIVADEPIASLDPSISAGILDLMRGICRSERVSVVCSLHQVHFARQYADRIVGLANGRVALDVATRQFDEGAASILYGSVAPAQAGA